MDHRGLSTRGTTWRTLNCGDVHRQFASSSCFVARRTESNKLGNTQTSPKSSLSPEGPIQHTTARNLHSNHLTMEANAEQGEFLRYEESVKVTARLISEDIEAAIFTRPW